MKLIQETDYAFRIMLSLYSSSKILSAGQISDNMNITEGFTKKILNKLIKQNLIRSHRGIDGGYSTILPPEEVSFHDIVCAIEGDLNINRCLVSEGECSRDIDKQDCAIRHELMRINSVMASELKKTTFDKLLG